MKTIGLITKYKGVAMSKVVLVNPANVTVGYSLITPRWLPVIARAVGLS